MARGGLRSPLPWLGALLLVYLGAPVVYFCYRLAVDPARGFHDAGLFSALWISLQGATIATAVVTVLGVPLAYYLARHRGVVAAVVGTLVTLPLAIPPVMGGILLIYLVGPYTPIGRFFGGHLTESLAGVVLAQMFVAAPFLVVAARAALGAVDPALEDVAATLGHGQLGRFWRVAVPTAAPGIGAGMLLTWLRAFGEYGATVVLAYHPSSLNVYTYIQFSSSGLPGTVAPTALALGVAALAVAASRMVVVRRRRRRGTAAMVLPVARHPDQPPPSPLSFDLDMRLGEFRLAVAHRADSLRLAVLGPSGSGKSTLLRCLAGLYGASPGTVAYGPRRVEAVPVQRRRIGYVAQGFSLFPHLSVWEQLLFATDADPGIAAYWLAALRLDGLERRLPSELSGGERQRVALAQALARSPDVLFLDEPLSSLDTPVRAELRREIRQLQERSSISTVLVTHDPEEAAHLADEVIVIDQGRTLQHGPSREVFECPSSPAAAELLGVRNVVPAVVTAGGLSCDGLSVVAHTGALAPGAAVLWRVAPADVVVSPGATATPGAPWPAPGDTGKVPGETVLEATVEELAWLGTRTEARLRLSPGVVIEADGSGLDRLRAAERCRVTLRAGDLRVWEAPGPAPAPPGTEASSR